MKRRRFLPEYVTSFKDRHGKERLRFRRKGYPSHYFASPLGTESFREEYRRCIEAAPPLVGAGRAAPGTIDDLVARYLASPGRLGPTSTTQAKVRSIIDKFRDGRGDRRVADVRFEHIDAIISRKREKVLVGKRMHGGIEAARKLRKELVRLFDFAVKTGIIGTNPVQHADRVKVAAGDRSTGYHTWTEAEIAQYRGRHALGSKARLAMEMLLWTDQRRSDVVHLGRQHIEDGRFQIRQGKTGKSLGIAVAPQLLEAIVAMSPGQSSPMCFLLTEWGKPFTKAGFGNWFRDQCDAAGLAHCTAHGLRKATMRRMAELGLTNQQMKAVSGHTKDNEVARYTADANQQSMANTAIKALSRWELSNLAAGLDTNSGQAADNAG